MTSFTNEPETNQNPERKPVKLILAFVLIAALVITIVRLSASQQQPVNATSAVVKSTPQLSKITSYHLKYKLSLSGSGRTSNPAYYEYWYRSPSDWKLMLTQPGSKQIQLFSEGIGWSYIDVSGLALKTPVPDKELEKNIGFRVLSGTPQDIIKRIGRNYRYTGTGKVLNRVCNVIEGKLQGGSHEKYCIDRDTGILLQYVYAGQDKSCMKEEIVALEVNKPMPKDTFTLKLPAETIVIKAAAMTRGLAGLNRARVNAEPGAGSYENPFQESDLKSIADQGVAQNARLKHVYEPGYIPEGYKMVTAGSFGERRTMPDGAVNVDLTGGYNTLYADYINPKTGDTISLTESVDKLDNDEGREITENGFHGRITEYTKPFPYVKLSWKKDNVNFYLNATSLSEQEAVKIARSMRLIVVEPAKAPVSSRKQTNFNAGKLEFRYLPSIRGPKHPDAKYGMIMAKNDKGEDIYQFTDSKGKSIDSKQVIKESKLILSGTDLQPNSEYIPSANGNNPVIGIQFNKAGRKKFADFTRAHIDEYLAIIYNGRILSVPVIKAPILDGRAVIEGGFSVDEAKKLSETLNAR